MLMLNLFNLLKSDTPIKDHSKIDHTENKSKSKKHFPSSVREWNNSIYVYNKNTVNLIPLTTSLVIKIIKSYFSLFNKKIELKLRTKRLLLRFRRLSNNKIFVSNGEFKHTNSSVIITLYVFNRQKNNYLLVLKNWYVSYFFKKEFNKKFIKLLKSVNNLGLLALKKANIDKYYLLKAIDKIKFKNKYKVDSILTGKSIERYLYTFYMKLINRSLRKLELYLYYKQLLYINRSKLNYTFLQYLKKHLENIYNKNVEFNLINLKRFYLNSDILYESITLKLTKNRKKMSKFLNKLKNKVKVQKKRFLLIQNNELNYTEYNKHNLTRNSNTLQASVINNLKYRHVTGFRLEAKGRLTRRFTASRSLSKLRYKGNLLDIDSSYRGLSSVLLKGNLKSNLQFTKLGSKSRIGSFGVKGWVSGN